MALTLLVIFTVVSLVTVLIDWFRARRVNNSGRNGQAEQIANFNQKHALIALRSFYISATAGSRGTVPITATWIMGRPLQGRPRNFVPDDRPVLDMILNLSGHESLLWRRCSLP